jgi:hypothetical protein
MHVLRGVAVQLSEDECVVADHDHVNPSSPCTPGPLCKALPPPFQQPPTQLLHLLSLCPARPLPTSRPPPHQANADMCAKLGIPQSAAVTCIKPSGTVSQLTDSASGIHPRHSAHYIRRVRCNKDDPLTAFMAANGVPMEDCVMNPGSTAVSVVERNEGLDRLRAGWLGLGRLCVRMQEAYLPCIRVHCPCLAFFVTVVSLPHWIPMHRSRCPALRRATLCAHCHHLLYPLPPTQPSPCALLVTRILSACLSPNAA